MLASRVGDILRQAQHLADLAHRAARAIVDDGGGDAGAVAAIACIDVLDHLLAPLMLEIDIDIGRLVALLGDEAREQQVVLRRIDRGDAEQDSRRPNWPPSRAPGTGSAVARAGEAHDVVDGQEVAGVFLALAISANSSSSSACDLVGHALGP